MDESTMGQLSEFFWRGKGRGFVQFPAGGL